MNDSVEEIKNRLDIVDIISSYVPLKKAGANFKALCPFHQEKTPSFFVSREKQIWHCFGCGRGGDLISFVMEMEGLDFYEALKVLAEKAGVKIKPLEKEAYTEKKRLYELNDIASKFFSHILLKTKPGKRALEYLKKRGLKEETIEEFRIGYAPNNKYLLSKFLIKNNYPIPLIVKSGLCIQKDFFSPNETPIFDRFRGRVMFPIINQAGLVVGFSGRILPVFEKENIAKYLNSPDSPIFNKSFVLYGLNFAKQEILKKGFVIIVEGQMDVISSHQHGFKNTIASSGTSLTEQQLDLIRRFSSNIYFAFDQDEAGQIATERGIKLALSKDFNVYIVFIPRPYKDVDECLRKNPIKWERALENKKEVIEYFLTIYFSKNAKEANVEQGVEKILSFIKIIKNPIVQGKWIRKLSTILNISEPFLYEALSRVESLEIEKEKIFPQKKEDFYEKMKKRVFAILFVFPKLYEKNKDTIDKIFSKNSIYRIWLKFYNQKKLTKDKFLAKLKDPALPLAVLEVEKNLENDTLLAEKELKDLIGFFKKEYKEREIGKLQEEIKKCEKRKDSRKLKKLLKKLQDLIIS